jgi:CheY-like chemotaxis protein
MARILVVDDQPEIADLVQAVLEDDGHAADAVYSGQAALERLTQTGYDLIVCDVRMPDVDGKAVFRAVAQLGPGRPVVLFMTGYGDSQPDSEFLRATTAVVLAKPLGIDALLERVRRLLTSPVSQPGAPT